MSASTIAANQLTWDAAPDILTVEEAAALVRIPRAAAYEAVRAGLLPATNFGKRRIRVSKCILGKVFGIDARQTEEPLPLTAWKKAT